MRGTRSCRRDVRNMIHLPGAVVPRKPGSSSRNEVRQVSIAASCCRRRQCALGCDKRTTSSYNSQLFEAGRKLPALICRSSAAPFLLPPSASPQPRVEFKLTAVPEHHKHERDMSPRAARMGVDMKSNDPLRFCGSSACISNAANARMPAPGPLCTLRSQRGEGDPKPSTRQPTAPRVGAVGSREARTAVTSARLSCLAEKPSLLASHPLLSLLHLPSECAFTLESPARSYPSRTPTCRRTKSSSSTSLTMDVTVRWVTARASKREPTLMQSICTVWARRRNSSATSAPSPSWASPV